MTRRTAAGLIGLLTLAACQSSESGGDERWDRPQPVVVQLLSGSEPHGVLSYRGNNQDGRLGTHCWARRCVDFIGPPTPKTFMRVPGDAVIELMGNGRADSLTVGTPPEEEFGQLGQEQRVQVEDGRAHLDLEPGRYVLVVFARWPDGDAILTFGLEAA